jgi:hypothetical protein
MRECPNDNKFCEGSIIFFIRNPDPANERESGRIPDRRCERHIRAFKKFRIKVISREEYETLVILKE